MTSPHLLSIVVPSAGGGLEVGEHSDFARPSTSHSGGGDEWRDCVQWFIRLGIFSESHRVNRPAARAADFAQMLR